MQQQIQLSSAIVVVVEGLGPSLVGAYGSSTALTPAVDRLATQGILLDQCFVDAQELPMQLRSLWTGQHALQHLVAGASNFTPPNVSSAKGTGNAVAGEAWSLWQACQQRMEASDWQAQLLTDCPSVARLAETWGCPSITLVEPKFASAAASDSSQCSVMELFATAAELLKTSPPGLVWIHSRGLRHPWDAPIALRQQFVDPEDPEPPHEVGPPALDITPSVDPDLIVGWGQVAAAQVAVIDEALSALRDTVALRADADTWHWLFTSLASVPLGEHGRLGWGRAQLYGTELQTATVLVPALQSQVRSCPIGERRPELFQLPDVAATLASMLQFELPTGIWGRSVLPLEAAQSPDRWPNEFQTAMMSTSKQHWIRSPAWSAVLDRADSMNPAGDDHETLEVSEDDRNDCWLFVKPEDRWEVSQIADRRRDIVAYHRQLAPLFEAAVQRNDRAALPRLNEELLNLLR